MQIKILGVKSAKALYDVEKECFSHPWTEAMFLGDLKSTNTIYLGAYFRDELVGYAGAWLVLGDADITNVAVIPRARRKGVAKALLLSLFSEISKNGGKTIRLEVRKSNESAKNLYKAMGFSEIAVRKNYYADNKEDALIYEKNL